MAQMGRPGLSAAKKRELWQRWKDGASLSDIARALGKQPGSIHGVVAANGGFVPAERGRSCRGRRVDAGSLGAWRSRSAAREEPGTFLPAAAGGHG